MQVKNNKYTMASMTIYDNQQVKYLDRNFGNRITIYCNILPKKTGSALRQLN